MQQPAPPPKLNLRKLESLQRVLRYAAALVLAVFVGLIAYSGYKLRQINREIADKQARLAGLDETLKRKEREIAELDKKVETQDATIGTLIDPKRQLTDEQAEQVERTVEEYVAEIKNPNQIPPRVYIQYSHAEQEKRVGEVARQLQSRGFLTPGISRYKGTAPWITRLSYYMTDEGAQDDVVRDDLRNLLSYFKSIGLKAGSLNRVRETKGVRPRHYDVVFGEDFGSAAPPVETTPTPATEPTREPTPRPTRRPTPGPTRERTPRPPVEPTPDRGQRNG